MIDRDRLNYSLDIVSCLGALFCERGIKIEAVNTEFCFTYNQFYGNRKLLSFYTMNVGVHEHVNESSTSSLLHCSVYK